MELTKIKMTGFKSFADPITISFPAQWNCIVGPNGCGKSNTIDAIRCVMGESAAKQLRGGAMEDMIFNGCATRKPAGMASIELSFDNSDGGLGGPYAAYSEISIKRSVNRDGQSNYYLNGTRCRRRDIADVFLGTGLGPRSYSIIEQGTISRVVEAKPMEMRAYLEEAAGVSKYKERRKETENRIKHTRENLERVEDLRNELDKQQSHLKRQANAAERFQELKAQARITEARRIVLSWQLLEEERQQQSLSIEQMQTSLEESQASSQHIDRHLTELDAVFADKQEAHSIKQAKVYECVAEINKHEQQIEYYQKQQNQRNQEIAEINANLAENQQDLGGDQSRLNELVELKQNLAPELETLREQHEETSAALAEAEAQNRHCQSEWEQSQQKTTQSQRDVDVNAQKKEHLSSQISQCEQRIAEIQTELDGVNAQVESVDVSHLQSEWDMKAEQLAERQNELATTKENILQMQATIDDDKASLLHKQEQKQMLQGELSSLRALQKTALGKHQEALNDWLSQHALSDKPRMAENLDVDPQWAMAIETVLNQDLDAVCVDNIQDIAQQIDAWPAQSLTLISQSVDSTTHTTTHGLSSLANKVLAGGAHPALQSVYAVATLTEGLDKVGQLAAHESVITPEGLWLSASWLKVIKKDESQGGVLQREQQIKEKQATVDTLIDDIDQLQYVISNHQTTLTSLKDEADCLQQTCQEISAAQAEIKGDLRAQQSRIEEFQQRQTQLAESLARQQDRASTQQAEYEEVVERLLQAQTLLSELQDSRSEVEAQRESAQSQLLDCREQAMDVRERLHESEMKWKTIETELSSVDQAQSRLLGHIDRLQSQKQALLDQAENQPNAIESMQLALESALNNKITAEGESQEAKNILDEHESRRREYEHQRSEAQSGSEGLREKLERLRIKLENVNVKQASLMELFAHLDTDKQVISDEMPEGASVDQLTKEGESLEGQISRLGAINLAAIEEYKTVSERKEYLDAQNEDLESALATLESAIKKIDQETRSKLRETFELINNKFQELFPSVFGGGQASLVLTEQDWLTTGISITARPPGKRNTSIHMLSGGEKALTAIAFVFAIFHLNPAPFCMLDEVDAPLDDANVERFCRLVKEMSATVKFIVISHNKLTISKANNLIGVTMKEAGVSRTVSVDVDEAVRLSE